MQGDGKSYKQSLHLMQHLIDIAAVLRSACMVVSPLHQCSHPVIRD